MELHLVISGILLMVLALIHVTFPRYFQWKDQLAGLSLINRQMMQTHTFFIALTLLQMGVLCVAMPVELASTKLGHTICLGLCIFWTVRLLFQFFFYASVLWKGKPFETTVHLFFSALWVYFASVFFFAWKG